MTKIAVQLPGSALSPTTTTAIQESYRELFLLASFMPPDSLLQPSLSRHSLCPGSFIASPLMFGEIAFSSGFKPGKWQTAGPPTASHHTSSGLEPLVQRNLSALSGAPFPREHGFLLPAGIAMLSAPAEAVSDFPVLSLSTKCSISYLEKCEYYISCYSAITYNGNRLG